MAFIFAPSVEKFLFTFRGSALLSNQNSLLYSSFTSLVPFILLARTYTLLSLHTCNISICLCLHSKYTLRSQDGPSEKTPLLSSLPELVTQSAIHLRSLKQTHPWHIGPRIQPHGYRFANTASHDPPPKIRLPRSAFQDPSTKIRQPIIAISISPGTISTLSYQRPRMSVSPRIPRVLAMKAGKGTLALTVKRGR